MSLNEEKKKYYKIIVVIIYFILVKKKVCESDEADRSGHLGHSLGRMGVCCCLKCLEVKTKIHWTQSSPKYTPYNLCDAKQTPDRI